MNIEKKHWLLFILASLISLAVWARFSYPQLAFTEFSVDRSKALSIARKFLTEEQQIDLTPYQEAIVFHTDQETNRFLQKTIGYEGLVKFLEEHDFDLFYWVVRFFQEGEKEQHYVFVSSATGEVIAYRRLLEDTYAIPKIEREEARQKAIAYMKERFGFDPENYSIKGDLKHIYDNRSDYSFSWRKKSVAIPWSDDPTAGVGKLVVQIRVSGDKVLNFFKSSFLVPDLFRREIQRLNNTGSNLLTAVRILFFALFIASIYFIIVRRNHLAMHTTKKFYIMIMFTFLGLSFLTTLNQLQSILFDYDTATPLFDYLLRIAVDTLFYGLFVSVTIITPSLAGELLHFEQLPHKKEGSFLHFIRSSFFSRKVSTLIVLGYLTCMVMLGIQTVMFEIGQRYWGVWREYSWMIQLTSSYIPLLAGLTIAYKASFMEELMYRMFAISLGKKFFKSIAAAVIISSLLFGFGHSGYTVFPMWFRGVEVSVIGLFLALVYLRFGIIPVIVGHYLFDIFWGAAGYLLGHTNPLYFSSALILLLIPIGFAAAAFIVDHKKQERPLQWLLNNDQSFNLEVLRTYLRNHWDQYKDKDKQAIKDAIGRHKWDVAVIDIAVDEITKEKRGEASAG